MMLLYNISEQNLKYLVLTEEKQNIYYYTKSVFLTIAYRTQIKKFPRGW